MGRRKKSSTGRNLGILSAVVIIGIIGYLFSTDQLDQVTTLFGGVTDQFPIGTNNEDFWAIPASFYFAITPVNGIHCWIAPTLTQGNIDGTQEILASSSGQGIQLFEITGGFATSAKEVRFVKDSTRMSCEDQSGQGRDIRLVGGTIRLESFVRDKVTGVETKVDSKFATIPALNRNLNVATGGGNILLPTLITQASTIESFINVPDTVASRNIDVIFRTSSYAQLNVVGAFTPVADLKTSIGGLLKFINPDFGASLPPTEKGTQVTMTKINPIQHYYIGNSGEVPSGATSSSIVTLNDEIRATFTGTQDNWSASEGIPTLTLKDPRGVTRASGIPMTTIKPLSGGLTEFSRIGVSIPFQITDNNIDLVKGTWTAQMIQAGRTQIGVKTFALLDSRPQVIDPDPMCNTATENLVDGKCVPKPTQCPAGSTGIFPNCSFTCPDPTELQETLADLPSQELLDAFTPLAIKESVTTLDSCEQQAISLIRAEANKRGIDLTAPPPTTGDSLGSAFITYSSSLTDQFGNVGGGGGCPLTGQVPVTALPVVGLQLLGLGTCDGLRFGSVELTPTLDFGADVKNILITQSSISLQQDLFLAKNNPYPSKPAISCTTPTTSNIGLCSVTNHNFGNDGTGNIQISPNEVTFVRNFIDKDTRGDYEIVKVVFQENTLIDKIQRNGVVLNDGDEVSLMYLIWGTFSGTDSGSPFIGSIPAMTFVQSFTFKTGVGGGTCDAPSMKVVFNNDGTVGEVGGESGQCLPCQELEDLGVGTCPPEVCPVGTEGIFPDCTVTTTCNLPNEIIDGVCRAPSNGCTAPQVANQQTGECEDPEMCFQDPVCTADEKFQVTEDKDQCGANILICVPRTTTPPPPPRQDCPNPDTQYRDSLGVCVNIMTTGCPEGEARNSLGICEDTGGITNPTPPDGNDPKPINFCQLGAEGFNLSQCLASIFTADGGQGLMITGITQTALLVVVMSAILVIVLAVIIRRRRGGGFGKI